MQGDMYKPADSVDVGFGDRGKQSEADDRSTSVKVLLEDKSESSAAG
jgi:hypothetical protein